jgi:hypothetical protein
MLEVFEVDVLEVLRWFTQYSMIGRPEKSKRTINRTEQKTEDNQQYDAIAR